MAWPLCDAAQARKPDLVLTDVMMPETGRFRPAARAPRRSEARTCPVILLSARAGEEARIEGMHAGADDYLIKPFSARELLARVEAHLKMAQLSPRCDAGLAPQHGSIRDIAQQGPPRRLSGRCQICAFARSIPTALPVFGDIPGGVVGRDFGRNHPHSLGKRATQTRSCASSSTRSRPESPTSRSSAPRSARTGVSRSTTSGVSTVFVCPTEAMEWCAIFAISPSKCMRQSTQQLLLNELNHRIKNTLANVQAIAQQTLRRTSDPADFANRF